MPFVYPCARVLAGLVARLWLRLRITGREHVPASGPLLIVANHGSFLDPPLVGVGVVRPVTYLARAGLFRVPVLGPLIRALNAVPLKESGSDTAAIRTALDALSRGGAVVIFPEGARSFDGSIQPFKRGVWLLLTRANCPVLPVGIAGAYDAWPRTRRWPRLLAPPVRVAIGAPVPPETLRPLDAAAGLEHLRGLVVALEAQARAQARALARSRGSAGVGGGLPAEAVAVTTTPPAGPPPSSVATPPR